MELDPEIFNWEPDFISDREIESLLNATITEDFDQENGEDSKTALDNLRTVQCPFNKDDIEFWFSQFEDQLTLIGVKKQWTKKIALVRFLPAPIQSQVKSLLTLKQSTAGDDIYLRIKTQLLKLYGAKPEDAYNRAKNRVLTGSPSELGKALVEDICPNDVKLQGCHCDRIVWGMFREKIPIVIRNHLADMPFNATTYEKVFDKADQVWDSNRSEELPTNQVAATSSDTSKEVAAVQKSGQNKSQKNKNQSQSQGKNQNQAKNKKPQKPAKPAADDKLCKMHAKWKENANFCSEKL